MFVINVMRLLRRWRRYEQSVRELSRLDDRELADLGITRSDILDVAWKEAQA